MTNTNVWTELGFDAEDILRAAASECAVSDGRLKAVLAKFVLLRGASVPPRRRVEIFLEEGNDEIPERLSHFLDEEALRTAGDFRPRLEETHARAALVSELVSDDASFAGNVVEEDFSKEFSLEA